MPDLTKENDDLSTTGNKAFVEYPSVSIVVTTLDNELTMEGCIQSIEELDYQKKSIEVLVIDAGSKDSTISIVEKHGVRLISKSLNAPAAYNYALKIVKSEIVGFIDADARVEKQWLKKLIPHLYNKEVAAAAGTIETWNKNRLISRCIGYDLNYRYNRIHGNVQRVATMNLILKKEVIEEVGGFDENLPTQYDTDVGTRISSAGYKIIVDTEAKCYHFHRSTLAQYFKQQFRYGENTVKLYFKHSHLMRGDEITDWWMNFQPILYVAISILLLAGLIQAFRPVAWMLSFFLATATIIQYTFSAIKLSFRYHDPTALALVVIYISRAVAWTLGAITTGIVTILRVRRAK